jgi:hypothetical protein
MVLPTKERLSESWILRPLTHRVPCLSDFVIWYSCDGQWPPSRLLGLVACIIETYKICKHSKRPGCSTSADEKGNRKVIKKEYKEGRKEGPKQTARNKLTEAEARHAATTLRGSGCRTLTSLCMTRETLDVWASHIPSRPFLPPTMDVAVLDAFKWAWNKETKEYSFNLRHQNKRSQRTSLNVQVSTDTVLTT